MVVVHMVQCAHYIEVGNQKGHFQPQVCIDGASWLEPNWCK